MTVKETVYNQLKASTNGYISGQDLADKCNVSRAAVWKAVNALKEDGCMIEAVSNKGYRLLAVNKFDKENIESFLKKESGISIIFHQCIDSTNTECKRLLLENPGKKLNKTVVVANEQTAGRGRLGRSFYSPSLTGIYFSIIYSGQMINDAAKITANTAVGICRAIKKTYGIDSSIKWINDIYIGGKKVSGVLTEGITNLETGLLDSVIIGIGINISLTDNVPEEIKNTAGGILSDENEYKRSQLCATVIQEVLEILDGDENSKNLAMQEYKERSFLIGRTVKVKPLIDESDISYDCTVIDITEDAKLVIKKQDNTTAIISSGEVTLHLNSFS